MLHCNAWHALSGCHQQACNAHAPLTARNKTDAHGFLRLSTQRHPKTTNSSHGCPRIPAIYNTRALSEHTVKPRMPTDSCNLQYKSHLRAHNEATDAHGFLQFAIQEPSQRTSCSHGCPRIPANCNTRASSKNQLQPRMPADSCNLQYESFLKEPAAATDAHGFLQFTIQELSKSTQ